jgi:hypothetical protein
VAEIAAFSREYGWFLAVAVYVIVKALPVALDKVWPQLLAQRQTEKARAARAMATELSTLTSVYDKFIAMQSQTLQFVGSATESINSMTRALDANTQQMFRLTDVVKEGPRCPLPACPFMQDEAHATNT